MSFFSSDLVWQKLWDNMLVSNTHYHLSWDIQLLIESVHRHFECLEHIHVEFEIFAYQMSFDFPSFCYVQTYILIVKIACEFEIPNCLAQSF